MTHPAPSFRAFALAWLGLDRITHLEATMANAREQLTELKAAFTDFSADVDAKLDQLLAAQGELQPDAQTVFDELKAAVQDADARVGDADGSDTPAPGPVDDTVPVEPVEGTNP